MSYARLLLALAAAAVLHGCAGDQTYSDEPATGARQGRHEVDQDRVNYKALGVYGDAIPGETSLKTWDYQVDYMRIEAIELERRVEEVDRLVEAQKAEADRHAKLARQAKEEARVLKHKKDDLSKQRYEALRRQEGYHVKEVWAADRMAARLQYDAGTLRTKARSVRQKVMTVEKLAPREKTTRATLHYGQ